MSGAVTLIDRPAMEAPWLMRDWVHWTLDELGREDVSTRSRICPGRIG